MALSLIDGLITRNGLRGQTFPDLWTQTWGGNFCIHNAGVCDPSWLARARTLQTTSTPPTWEVNPLMRPFVHDGLGSVLLGGVFWADTQAYLTRHWTPDERMKLDIVEAGLHVAGIQSWQKTLADQQAAYAYCDSPATKPTIRQKDDGTWFLAFKPGTPKVCSTFTSLPSYTLKGL